MDKLELKEPTYALDQTILFTGSHGNGLSQNAHYYLVTQQARIADLEKFIGDIMHYESPVGGAAVHKTLEYKQLFNKRI